MSREAQVYFLDLDGYLADPCQDCQGCIGCKSSVSQPELAVLKIAKNGKYSLDCESSFMIHQTLQGEQQNIPLIKSKSQCMVLVSLQHENDTQFTSLGLDSGAQISVINGTKLRSLFPDHKFCFEKAEVTLKSAANTAITCHGFLVLICKIGLCSRRIKFYVIEGTDTILLGYPDMEKFNIVLDTKNKTCSVNEILTSGVNEINEVMLVTPKYQYNISRNKTQYITLRAVPKQDYKLINCWVDIYFCSCLLQKREAQLCKCCLESGPLYTTFLSNLEVEIPFKDYILDYLNYKDQFQAVRRPQGPPDPAEGDLPHPAPWGDQGCDQDQEDQVNEVTVDDILAEESLAEPAGYCLENDELYLESPTILGRNPGIKEVFENPGTQAISQQFEPRKCEFCKATAKDSHFCDVTDTRCSVYRRFQKKILGPVSPQCNLLKVSKLKEEWLTNEVMFIHLIKLEESIQTLNLQCVANKLEEFKWQLMSCGSNSELYTIAQDNCVLYIGLYKRCVYFDHLTLLNKILICCQERKLTSISFINYHNLTMSEHSLATIFQGLKINIILLEPNAKEVNAISKSDQAFILENQDREQAVDRLKISEPGKQRLKEVFLEVSKEEDGLKSVWSDHSADVNYFHSPLHPFVPYSFDYIVKPGMENYEPQKERCRYVNKNIEENVEKMIVKLLETGIIYSSYSCWSAQSVWVRKKSDMQLSEWLEGGGKEEDFIPGTVSKKVTGIRHCVDFAQNNSIMSRHVLHQENPLSQIQYIASVAKFVTSFDVTSMFHALKLSKKASDYTGFNSGLRKIALNNLKYQATPMGHAQSSNLQNCALTFTLSNTQQVRLWADNILVFDTSEHDHIENIRTVLHLLRKHGLKLKFSKTILFAQDKFSAYGFTVDLPCRKIYPSSEKLLSLRQKPRPSTITELRALLGSIGFFKKFLGMIQPSIARLTQMTRRGKFIWTEENLRAYEAVMKMLAEPDLIHITTPDYSRSVEGITDSSLSMSSFLIFQRDAENRPRVLQYDTKIHPEKQSHYPPVLAELVGLIHLVSELQEQFAYHEPGVTVHTDSRPLVLICCSSHYNVKLSRIKIFLNSLGWLRLSYEKGSSDLIQIADYFTRDNDYSRKYSQKLPDEKEIDKVEKVATKFNEKQILSPAESFFCFDFLLSKEENDIENIKDNSCRIEGDCIKFQYKNCDLTQSGPSLRDAFKNEKIRDDPEKENQTAEKSGGCDETFSQTFSQTPPVEGESLCSVNQVVTRAQAMRNILFDNIEQPPLEPTHNLFRYLLPLTDSPGPRPAAGRRERRGEQISHENFSGFYQSFLENTFLLDHHGFVEAQKSDPFYSKIIQHCIEEGQHVIENKMYFLHEEILFVRYKLEGLSIYRVVLPLSLAYDMLTCLHRKRGHIREGKLLNLARLYYDFQSGERLTKRILSDCWQCVLTGPVTARERCNLPKQIALLTGARQAICVDELFLYKNKDFTSKILTFVCMFSHHVDIKFIEGNLTQVQFLNCVREIKASLGGDLKFLISDNSGVIDGQLVQETCQQLGLIKLTISSYQYKSNLAELMNKLVLQTLRHMSAQHCCTPAMIKTLIERSVECLNATPFANSRYISPHALYFGRLPTKDAFDVLDLDGSAFKNKEAYFKASILLNKYFRDIRSGYLRRRKQETEAKAEMDQNQKKFKKYKIGDHVTILNRQREQGGWKKLANNFTGLYEIIFMSASALFVLPVNDKSTATRDPTRRKVVVKVDKAHVRKVTPPLAAAPDWNYFAEWGMHNYMPKRIYHNFQEIGTYYQLTGLNDPEAKINKIISFYIDSQNAAESKSAIKTFSESQKVYMLKGLRRRNNVTFHEDVTFWLISPGLNYEKLLSICPLKDQAHSVKRTFRAASGIFSCQCKFCRQEMPNCFLTQCPECRLHTL